MTGDDVDDKRVERMLERSILALLAQREADKTICVSEAARLAYREIAGVSSDDPHDEGWRDLMEPARRAARRLVAAGDVVITQGGEVVDPATIRGPIRIRLNRA